LKWVGLYPIQLVDDDRVGLGHHHLVGLGVLVPGVDSADLDGVVQLGVGVVLDELLRVLLVGEGLDLVALCHRGRSLLDHLGSWSLGRGDLDCWCRDGLLCNEVVVLLEAELDLVDGGVALLARAAADFCHGILLETMSVMILMRDHHCRLQSKA